MPMEVFHLRFPEVAAREIRSLNVIEDDSLRPGTYTLFESYCNEHHCDCRRVFLNVVLREEERVVAVINFGWEGAEFYRRWMHGAADEALLREMRGPSLARTGPYDRTAREVLEVVREVAFDPEYVERLKRHYRLFRDAVDEEPSPRTHDTSRNAPCPCGSGKKYKRCCGIPIARNAR